MGIQLPGRSLLLMLSICGSLYFRFKRAGWL